MYSILLTKVTISSLFSKLPNSDQNVQECDATDDDSPQDAAHNNTAGFKIIVLNFVSLTIIAIKNSFV